MPPYGDAFNAGRFAQRQTDVNTARNAVYEQGMALPGIFKALQDAALSQAGNIQTNFGQFVPTLNTNFTPSGGLDDYSRSLLSLGSQQVQRGVAATGNEINRTVGAGTPLAGVLRNQAAFTSRLQANPLLMQVQAAQRDRQINEQRLSNETKLAQQQASSNAQAQGNAAIGQQFGLQAVPAQAQTQLLQALSGVFDVAKTK